MKRRVATIATTTLLLLGACGSSDPSALDTSPATESPAPSPAEGVTIDIVLEDGAVAPAGDRVEVIAGETVILNIDSDTTDEIHVHSDPEHEFSVVPGDDQSFTFTVEVSGQVAVESHGLDRTIVQLLVR